MASPAIANLVHETATTTGTGNFTLSNVNGKQSFNGAFGNGATTNVFYYFISNRDAAEWEVGTGHMSAASTLVRDTVIASTNSNNAVNFSAGTKDVSNDLTAVLHNSRPFFSAQSTAGTTLAANGFTKIAFDTEVYDSDGCYDPTTNYRFTPNQPGKYFVYMIFALAGAPTVAALFAADIYLDGTRYQQALKYVATSDTAASMLVSAIIECNGSSNYIEAFGYNGQAANTRTIDNNTFANCFGAFRVGP